MSLAVMDARQAQENIIINGGDDDARIEDHPTHHEDLPKSLALAHQSSRYLNDLHRDPVARKLEALLGSFGHQNSCSVQYVGIVLPVSLHKIIF
jgi:hypothetical protein